MLRSILTTLDTVAVLAALLLTSGCNLDRLEMDDGIGPVATATASASAVPDRGQEIHRMFEAQKQNATMTELPPQF